jgi:hypothetical protein
MDMPRSHGLRDDDLLGRLAEIETRMDALEGGHDAPTGRTTDAARVPERDERRDTEVRNRQVHVTAAPADPGYPPGMPDSMGGERVADRTRIVDGAARDVAERRARQEADEKAKPKADDAAKAAEPARAFGAKDAAKKE